MDVSVDFADAEKYQIWKKVKYNMVILAVIWENYERGKLQTCQSLSAYMCLNATKRFREMGKKGESWSMEDTYSYSISSENYHIHVRKQHDE